MWETGIFLMSEKVSSCVNYLDSKLSGNKVNFQFNTSTCYYDTQTPEWLGDGCCNNLLQQWGVKCCHPRENNGDFLQFSNVVNKASKQCLNSDKSLNLLKDYVNLRNLYLDPKSGCKVISFFFIIFNLYF